VAAATAIFYGILTAEYALKSSTATSALKPSGESGINYVLCEADLSAGIDPEEDSYRNHAYILLRVDENKRIIHMIYVPSNLRVTLSNNNRYQLWQASSFGGDAAIINTISTYVGVNISHYVKTNLEGLAYLAKLSGSLAVTLFEEVTDDKGNVVIPAGNQIATAENIEALLCCTDYAKGTNSQAQNLMSFTASVIPRMLEISGVPFILRLDELSKYFETDLTIYDIIRYANEFRSIAAIDMGRACIPGSIVTTNNIDYYVATTNEWSRIKERFVAGLDPSYVQDIDQDFDRASITIDVRNANSTEGVAAYCAQVLREAGFTVSNVANVEDGVNYPETLVVYHDEQYIAAGQAVINTIGAGRLINGGDDYRFDTTLYIALGVDYYIPSNKDN
ncbi:MAG: LCP family protein, partial [Eggerthellaceae bacterium]|nr:LCP family protein [Eggerthellaceae bacterium]